MGLAFGGGFAFAEGEVEAVAGAVAGEVVGEKLDANFGIALGDAEIEVHADGLRIAGEIAAEESPIAAGTNCGLVFYYPTALLAAFAVFIAFDVGENPIGRFLKSLNQNSTFAGARHQSLDVLARDGQPTAMGGLEGEGFVVEGDELTGKLITGEEEHLAVGRISFGGFRGGLELEKANGAGFEMERFCHGGVLPANAFGGVEP